MNDYKELIYKIRGAAARWEEEHPIVGVGQMRYCDALRDAAGAIEQLVKERKELKEVNLLLKANCDHFKRERDAAIAFVPRVCKTCNRDGLQYLAGGKLDSLCDTCRRNRRCNWEWCGVREVEHGND